ncbi:MAG: hypothetical protein PHF42_09525 [Pseudomonas sp.]|nr:hypothetical protein [Pseudomonas sp.]
MPIIIQNNGPEIVATNYWQTQNAADGLLYLTASGGCLRLLVPKPLEKIVPILQGAEIVSVEHSTFRGQKSYDLVFHDGTAEPFVITVVATSVDWRSLLWGRANFFSVWTEQGQQLSRRCAMRL